MYTAETLTRAIGHFSEQIDARVSAGSPNSGRSTPSELNGLRTEQRYVNGDTELGRLSATVIERFANDKLVIQHFTLSNHRLYAGEDAPDGDTLDTTLTYKLYVNAVDGCFGAEYTSLDNAGFKAHLEEYAQLPQDDTEARAEYIDADDDFSLERPIEPGEMEYIGFLVTQVTRCSS